MNRSLPRRAVLACLMGALLPGALPGSAVAQTDGPTAPIQQLNAALLQTMQAAATTPFAGRVKLIAPAVAAAFDLGQILRASAGPRWSAFSPAQQAALLDVFTHYTVASYAANFDGFDGERFEILPELRPAGADQIVQTRIVPRTGDTAQIDYQMRQTPNGWRAVDVLLDGSISRVAIQRSDFRALLASGDPAPLIASLQAKIAALEAGGKQ